MSGWLHVNRVQCLLCWCMTHPQWCIQLSGCQSTSAYSITSNWIVLWEEYNSIHGCVPQGCGQLSSVIIAADNVSTLKILLSAKEVYISLIIKEGYMLFSTHATGNCTKF